MTKTQEIINKATEAGVKDWFTFLSFSKDNIDSGLIFNKVKKELGIEKPKGYLTKKEKEKKKRQAIYGVNKDEVLSLLENGSNDKLLWDIFKERKHNNSCLMASVDFSKLFKRSYGRD